jgi:predicted enzyme related to lactoylglutathione lyase
MAWYDDKKKKFHIVTYKNEKDATKEANKAAEKGWKIQGTATKNPGWSWLAGMTRASQITVTYIRSDEE